MSNFENILRFSHFSITLDMSRITHFLAEIMIPKNSASGNISTFFMSVRGVLTNNQRWRGTLSSYFGIFWTQSTSLDKYIIEGRGSSVM